MKISLAGWSLHRRFRAQQNSLSLLEFPRVARQEFGIPAIELNSPFFVSRDKRYLTELDDIAVGEGVDLLNIAVDGTGDLCDPDRVARQRAIENNAAWLTVAAHLGCTAIRVNTGGKGYEEEEDALLWCIDAYMELALRGSRAGVIVLIENHGGLSANPDNIVQIIEAVNSPWIGTLVDFGNYPPDIDRYEALEKLMPYAAVVHARMSEFNEEGLDTKIDIPHCYYIAKRAGYDGYLGIEFAGEGSDHDGVLKAKKLLERCLRGEFKEETTASKSIDRTMGVVKKIPGMKSVSGGLRKIPGLKKLGLSRKKKDADRSPGS